jgi:hypothetical protein
MKETVTASGLLTMSPADFCAATEACADGREFALTQPTMADVWDECPRPDWLLWIVEKLGQQPDDRTLRLFAIWCARNTPLPDGSKTGDLLTDPRSLAALEVAERYADRKATAAALAAARDAARAAARAAYAAGDAARDAAYAAWDATWDAAGDAAHYSAWAAARAAARDAAQVAWGAAWDAAADAQAAHLRTLMRNPFRNSP